MSLARRPLAAVAVSALVASGLVLVSSTLTAAGAAEGTETVTFRDCEVREDHYGTNKRIKDDITWNTPVRLSIPSPVRAGEEVTIETELGPLPADILPQDLSEVRVSPSVDFDNELAMPFNLADYAVYVGEYDATAPMALEEIEVDKAFSHAGVFHNRVKSVSVFLEGEDGGGATVDYTFSCDQLVSPTSIVTTAVYDPDATPTVTLDRLSVKQGGSVHVTGEHLLGSAPTTPAAEATVTVDGVVVGTFAIDESGAIDAKITVPPFAAPGSVQVQVSNGSRRASATLQVKAGKGKVVASPKQAKSGKKVKVKGSKFKPGETVKLILKGGRGSGTKAFASSAKANAAGAFTKAITLKKAAKGVWKVKAAGSASKRSARTSFAVR